MKKYLTICVLTLCVGFFSCSSDCSKSKDDVYVQFRQFLKKFKPLQLPLTLKIGSIETKNLPNIDYKSLDTLFIDASYSVCYGMLPDTSSYFGLIVLMAADDILPFLLTYDKTGKLMSKEDLVRGCGSGPGIEYCSSIGIIKKDLTIYCTDTSKTFEYDNKGKAVNKRYYCISKEGKINKDGKITMTKEQTKDLK